MGPQGLRPAPSGTALEAFGRELGVEVAVRSTDESGDERRTAATASEYSAEKLRLQLAQGRIARERLDTAYGGAAPSLDALPPATDIVSTLARARGLIFDLDRQPEARKLLEAIFELEPGHVVARELLAASHQRKGEFGEAIRVFRELVAAFPKRPRFVLQLARALIGRDVRGERSASTADGSARQNTAQEREAIVRGQREGERLLATLVTGPLGVEACYDLCNRLLVRSQAERAETAVRKALAARPKHPELEYLLGRALRFQGRFDEALVILAPIANMDAKALGRVPSDARRQIVWCLRGLGRYRDALAQLDRCRRQIAELGASTKFLDSLGAALAEEVQRGVRVSYSIDELRYFLRKSPDRARRENALEILIQNVSKVVAVEADFLHVLRRDADEDLRARALVALLRMRTWNEQAIAIALHDPSARNRLVAAAQTRRLPRALATRLLFEALCREPDPATFKGMHDRLAASSEIRFFLVAGRAEDEEGRDSVCDEWAEKLGMPRRAKRSKTAPANERDKKARNDGDPKKQEKQT